jgi:hypothetical protein
VAPLGNATLAPVITAAHDTHQLSASRTASGAARRLSSYLLVLMEFEALA